MKKKILILGAGPGGYVAALYAAQLGAEVTVVEKDKPGGVCLQRGCIPTKALLHGASLYRKMKKSAADYGITAENVAINYRALKDKSTRVVDFLTKGVHFLFERRGVRLMKGIGRLVSPLVLSVEKENGEVEEIEGDAVIVATGSSPCHPSAFPFDKETFCSGEEILTWNDVPESLLVIGAGAVGLEMAVLFQSIGCKVSVVEMMDHVMPGCDAGMAKALALELKKMGIKILEKTKAENISQSDNGYEIAVSGGKTLKAQRVLAAVGRTANIDGIGLDKVGVKVEKGFIAAGEDLQTSVPGVYAIGDVIGGALLAHKASHEGIVSVENIFGAHKTLDYRGMPNCIYTFPELAWVGLTEEEARAEGVDFITGQFPYRALGKANAAGETAGLVKIIAENTTHRVIGVHVLHDHASDLIAEGVLAIHKNLSLEDLTSAIHTHPTLSEGLMESAFAALKTPIHVI